MASKHTPGPWHAERSEEFGTIEIGVGHFKHFHVIATLSSYENDTQANARLIAAAPEMLGALIRIASISGSTGGPESALREMRHIASLLVARIESQS